jgi:hypothetical protein
MISTRKPKPARARTFPPAQLQPPGSTPPFVFAGEKRLRRLKLLPGLAIIGTALAALFLSGRAWAQTNFATLVNDGAWTWYNDPRALFHNGMLYFGYVRSSDGSSCLNVFNLQSGQTTNLWVSSRKETDDHDVSGLLTKQDGTMLAIYSRHQTDQFFTCRLSTSTNPATAADWGPEHTNTTAYASQGMTYANPYQLTNEAGKIYNFARNQNYNPCVFTSTNGGSNWTSAQIVIQTGTGGTRPYVKYCSDYNSRIDFIYTDAHPDNAVTSLYHLYYQNGSFYQTDGTFLKSYANLPILHDSGERGTVIYQYSAAAQADPNQWIPTGRAWNWEIAYQTNGWPVCVFQAKVDNVTGTAWSDARIYYYYARWTGTNWQKRFIAQAGRPLYNGQPDYGGGMCLDPLNPNTIYISTDAATPFDLSSTTNAATVALGANYQIWKGVTADGGLTFSWQLITGNSTVDNLRPYIPRRNGGEPCVIWFRGTYSAYTSYNCSIVGLFTTSVPTNSTGPTNDLTTITYIDATSGASGNTALAAGGTFSPPLNGTTGLDNQWEERTIYGSGGNIFESNGESAGEDAPRLVTTIAGLNAGSTYAIYAYFWSKAASSSTEQWLLRAGLQNTGGDLTLYGTSGSSSMGITSTAASLVSSTAGFAMAPTTVSESGRLLYQASLGNATADGSGTIQVFVDDYAHATTVNNRTWYDGVGYSHVINPNPTNMAFSVSGNTLMLSWPGSHLLWVLQSQTNGLSTGISTNWHDVGGSSASTQAVVGIDPANPAVFYRLRHP